MKRVSGALIVAALLLATPTLAQDDEEGPVSVGIAGGIVKTTNVSSPYLTVNARIRMGKKSGGEEQGGVSGYIEPEIGYWEEDESGVSQSDLLLGVNLGAAIRARSIEYFVGAGIGYHMFDLEIERANGSTLQDDDGVIGVNAQFGFDIRMTDLLSLYGVGRYDLIDRDKVEISGVQVQADDTQSKAYLGLRFRF